MCFCLEKDVHYLVVWDVDNSVSVISGKIIVAPTDVKERMVGTPCIVQTSYHGPLHNARIARMLVLAGSKKKMSCLEKRYLLKK